MSYFTFFNTHLTTSMEAAPDLKKSVVSSIAGTLLRMPFQMFCGQNNYKKTLHNKNSTLKIGYSMAVKMNQLRVSLPWSLLPSSSLHQSAPHWSFPQRRSIWKQGSSSHLQIAGSSPSASERIQSWLKNRQTTCAEFGTKLAAVMYLELSQRHDRVDPHSSRYFCLLRIFAFCLQRHSQVFHRIRRGQARSW